MVTYPEWVPADQEWAELDRDRDRLGSKVLACPAAILRQCARLPSVLRFGDYVRPTCDCTLLIVVHIRLCVLSTPRHFRFDGDA